MMDKDKRTRGGIMFDKYKSKSVTLRLTTHDNLYDLSKKIRPGDNLSVPRTIEYLKDFYDMNIGNYKGGTTKGITNDNKRQEAK